MIYFAITYGVIAGFFGVFVGGLTLLAESIGGKDNWLGAIWTGLVSGALWPLWLLKALMK